jgi:hypothetical protein
MQSMLKVGIIAATLWGLTGCGYRRVAPVQAPARVVPTDVEPRTSPPAPGTTRVLLEANGERATVMEITESTDSTANVYHDRGTAFGYAHSESQTPVCITPCFSDMKPGLHMLRFASEDDRNASTILVQVNDTPKVVRHALGHKEPTSLGRLLGVAMTISGATLLGGGAVMYGVAETTRDRDDEASQRLGKSGLTAGSVGLGFLLIGLPLMVLTRPTAQPGSTTELPFGR